MIGKCVYIMRWTAIIPTVSSPTFSGLDAGGWDLVNAYKNMRSCNLNTGITYSNIRNRQTVMVIALTSSPAEFQNSFDHEKGHLCRHISRAFGIDPYGEEAQYLSGYVGQKMFPVAKKFLCEHCRRSLCGK